MEYVTWSKTIWTQFNLHKTLKKTPHTTNAADYRGKTAFKPAIHQTNQNQRTKQSPVGGTSGPLPGPKSGQRNPNPVPLGPEPSKIQKEGNLIVHNQQHSKDYAVTKNVKYSYLDEDHRPLGAETGRMPPDPTKAKANEAEQIGHFIQEFKDLMLQG